MIIIKACRICGNQDIVEVLDLGKQPYANSLLENIDNIELSFPLSVSWCPECNLVQLNQTAEPEDLFSSYVWVTSTSKGALEHSTNLFRDTISRTKRVKEGYVLEIASNDGAFLKPFSENGYKVLGVDPAKNIVETAIANGIPTVCKFFDVKIAEGIIDEYGQARIILARNVLPHVAKLQDFVQGLSLCLAEDGLLVIEFHYAKIILEELHYDSIYHEHLCYYTIKSAERLLNPYGLYISDITESPISGGSLIMYINKKKAEQPVVQHYRNLEKQCKINNLDSWRDFARLSISHREQLLMVLHEIIGKAGPIVGYGASARSSTMLNYCGIDTQYLSVIADQNPLKQNLFTAGTHIPIASPEEVMKKIPEYVLILAWNFSDEIRGILKNRFGYKGQCLLPLPGSPEIVSV
ncbi:class I SAM-dependent methyltransferase [Chloroflexota bacterium]